MILDGPNAGTPAPVGAQVFPGYRPSDEADISRSNLALFVDLEGDVTDGLTVGLAGRAENYSDFGSTVNGKLAMRVEPVSGLYLRGAGSTGFRAPSVVQSYFASTATDFIGGNPVEIRTFPVSSPQARALGAVDLKAERSVNISAGIGAEPMKNLLFTVDAYNIDVKDRIVLSENFLGPEIEALLAPFDVAAGRFFTNAIDTRTRGIDVVLRYALDLASSGRLTFTGAFNTTKTEVTRVAATPAQLTGFDETLFGHVERTRIESGQPKDNINLSLGYTLDRFSVLLRATRFGEVTEPYPYNPSDEPTKYDQVFSAKWISDIDISYRVLNTLRFSVGGTNIFDVYPDKYMVVPDDDYNGLILPYSVFSPFGFNGAYFYTRASVEF
jgi:iron complex outermembrane receptor protein